MNQSPSCFPTEDFDKRIEMHLIIGFTQELVSLIYVHFEPTFSVKGWDVFYLDFTSDHRNVHHSRERIKFDQKEMEANEKRCYCSGDERTDKQLAWISSQPGSSYWAGKL